jgi:hypothetical protein
VVARYPLVFCTEGTAFSLSATCPHSLYSKETKPNTRGRGSSIALDKPGELQQRIPKQIVEATETRKLGKEMSKEPRTARQPATLPLWKKCMQGNVRNSSPSSYSHRHTIHCFASSDLSEVAAAHSEAWYVRVGNKSNRDCGAPCGSSCCANRASTVDEARSCTTDHHSLHNILWESGTRTTPDGRETCENRPPTTTPTHINCAGFVSW